MASRILSQRLYSPVYQLMTFLPGPVMLKYFSALQRGSQQVTVIYLGQKNMTDIICFHSHLKYLPMSVLIGGTPASLNSER
jgi:hypothetical protein